MVAKSNEAIAAKKKRDAKSHNDYKASGFVSVQSTVHETQRPLVREYAKKLRRQWRKANKGNGNA